MSQPNTSVKTTVKATMSQRYEGRQYGSGDLIEMTESDAADSVALNMSRRVAKLPPMPRLPDPVVAPANRAMQAKEPQDEAQDSPAAAGSTLTPTAGAGAAPEGSAEAPAAAPAGGAQRAGSGNPQNRYPQRAVNGRR